MLKEYFESVERGEKEQREMRHRFFAQHPELVGQGRNLWEEPEESERKIIYQDMRWTPRQGEAISQLKGEVTYLMNKLNEHIDISKRKKREAKY